MRQSYLKNAALMTGADVLLRLAGMGLRIWLANALGGEGMGLYQLVLAVYSLFVTLATAGVSVAATRLMAEELARSPAEARGMLHRLLLAGAGLGVLALAAQFGLAGLAAKWWLGDVRAAGALRLSALGLPWMAVSSVLRGFFIARRQVEPNVLSQLAEQTVRIGIVWAALERADALGWDVGGRCTAVLGATAVSEAVSTGLMALFYRKEARRCFGARPACRPQEPGKRLWDILWPVEGGRCLASALHTAENMLVPACLAVYLQFSGGRAEAVAQYGSLKGMALPLLTFPFGLLGSLSVLLMPEITQAHIRGESARLDCLLSFATAARENNYIRPVISDDEVLEIHQGRHPVIEKQLPIGEKYVANDVMLDSSTQQIIIITGPNMAGKSALLRQTALITLMAQIGCFVPAESAHIGLVDKIFTRVGASDNISVGESTFMVEMNEAADILNNLSPRSLVLFDELGRGTSTYDGISIAWAIVEYIHEHPHAKARTLFATHYHELNEMEKSFKRIKNYNVSVKEIDNKVIFLRKLERGGSEHSFGIHVAKMAGMPKSIVKRAGDILKQLEKDNRQQGIAAKPMVEVGETRGGMQLSFFQLDDPVLCQIRDEILNLDVNNLTPLEALNKLNDIKRIVKGK